MASDTGKLRMGMVGGGRGAFIGPVHRMAAALAGGIELAAGCFSRDYENTVDTGLSLGLPADRCYRSFADMAKAEAGLPEGDRIDFVVIVTPPNLHYPVASAFLDSGMHVLTDKPLTYSLDEAVRLAEAARSSGVLVGVTHNYIGYPMVRQAREMVRNGAIGQVRRVLVEYLQDCLAMPTPAGSKPWRLDPEQVGVCGSLGEAGVHCASLLEYITGDMIEQVCVDRTTFLPGRVLEEDASVLLRLAGGGRGSVTVSQVAAGEDNNLNIRVYGSEGSLVWRQEEPDRLELYQLGRPRQILVRGHREYLADAATRATFLPPGHPEGFLEAFANIYAAFAEVIRRRKRGEASGFEDCEFPTVQDGLRTMAFVDSCVRSSDSGSRWTTV